MTSARVADAPYGRGIFERTPLTAWPPTATPSWASSPTARTAVVTISVPPRGEPPASSGVAHPAGGGSSRAAAACCGASGAAASFRCADPRGFAAELRAFAEEPDFAAPPDFVPDLRADDVAVDRDFAADDFGFAADLRAEEVFAEEDFAPDDFAEDVFVAEDFAAVVFALDFGFAAVALDFALDFGFAADLRADDVAELAFALVDFAAEELDFAPAFAAEERDLGVGFAPPDLLAVALPDDARFAERVGRAGAAASSPDADRERASSRALPSRLLERLTRRERGRLEKTSPLDSSAIG